MSTTDMVRFTLNRVNRDYPVTSGHEIDIWHQNAGRILQYNRLWQYYKGNQWNYVPEAGEPVTTANYVQLFVDKHAQYLFGKQFTVHSNFRGSSNQAAEDLLNEEWEKNHIAQLGFQIGQTGGVTGDVWVNVGIDNDPIFGDRVKISVFPSEYVFPIFNKLSDRGYTALLVQWPESEVVSNAFGRVRVRTYVAGQYWTKEEVWELRDGQPISASKPNILREIPFTHIPNVTVGTEFFGMSDIGNIVDIQREYNEKMTDLSDIINYHAAPVTVIYGAKASSLQKGARKVWSGLPKDSRIENLELQGDLSAAREHLESLKDTLFQLGAMPKVAFGGDIPISNTSGVALALQFAPILEHLEKRQLTYSRGIQYVNYQILRIKEILGTYRANGRPLPYYNSVKWPDPLPRDKQLRLNELQIMQQMLLLSRVQILKELIHDDIAPAELEDRNVQQILDDAFQEQEKYAPLLMGQTPGQNPVAAAEGASMQAQQQASAQATGV